MTVTTAGVNLDEVIPALLHQQVACAAAISATKPVIGARRQDAGVARPQNNIRRIAIHRLRLHPHPALEAVTVILHLGVAMPRDFLTGLDRKFTHPHVIGAQDFLDGFDAVMGAVRRHNVAPVVAPP